MQELLTFVIGIDYSMEVTGWTSIRNGCRRLTRSATAQYWNVMEIGMAVLVMAGIFIRSIA